MNDPRLSELLELGRQIWADQPTMDLPHVTAAACTVTGDIARISRDEIEGHADRSTLARELGNLILSSVRWASDLGLDPVVCVTEAQAAQRRYVARRGRNADRGNAGQR